MGRNGRLADGARRRIGPRRVLQEHLDDGVGRERHALPIRYSTDDGTRNRSLRERGSDVQRHDDEGEQQ